MSAQRLVKMILSVLLDPALVTQDAVRGWPWLKSCVILSLDQIIIAKLDTGFHLDAAWHETSSSSGRSVAMSGFIFCETTVVHMNARTRGCPSYDRYY